MPSPIRRFPPPWAHAVLGAALVAFLIVHLIQVWPLLDDPRQYVLDAAERIESGGTRRAAIGVLVLITLHAMLALGALSRRPPDVARAARGLDHVQITAGVLSAAFVVYHVLHVRVLEAGPHLGAASGYGALLASLGQPLCFAAYVVGVTAICFHVAFGGARFTSGDAAGSRGARIALGTLGLVLWALWLQPLARLATGAALF